MLRGVRGSSPAGLVLTSKTSGQKSPPLTLDRRVEWVDRATGELAGGWYFDLRLGRLRRRLKAWGACCPPGAAVLLVTLTYRPEERWSARHVSCFLRWARRRLGDGLLGYAWVVEVQERGAPHYHVLLVVDRRAWLPPPDMLSARAGRRGRPRGMGWVHGMTNVVRLQSVPAGVRYLLSYASKSSQRALRVRVWDGRGTVHERRAWVRGMRWFGVVWRRPAGGDVLARYRLSSRPRWVREAFSLLLGGEAALLEAAVRGDLPLRNRGGGWRLGRDVVLSGWTLHRLEPLRGVVDVVSGAA